MTRINVGIPPADLVNQHLIAEHREIKRIPNTIKKRLEKGHTIKQILKGKPDEFKLGTGHVKFFYDKLGYLKNRYEKLYSQCKKYGYNVQYYGDAWSGIPDELLGDYTPTKKGIEEVSKRITERLNSMNDKA